MKAASIITQLGTLDHLDAAPLDLLQFQNKLRGAFETNSSGGKLCTGDIAILVR